MSKENNFTKFLSMGNNDLIRIIVGGQSGNITKNNIVTDINDLLVALGFLKTTTSTIAKTRKVESFGTGLTIDTDNDVVLMDATSGSLIIELPLASTFFDVSTKEGQRFTIKKVDASAVNTVTVNAFSGDLIDGQTSIILQTALRPFITIVSDGADWWLI